MTIAAATIALATALAVFPMLNAGKLRLPIYTLGAAALLSLSLPLLWRARDTWLPLFLLGAEFVSADSSGHLGAASIVAYAAGLIGLCELLFWFAELPPEASVDATAIGRRLLLLALSGFAAASLALVALFASSVRLGSALAALLLGALAAATLLTIPLLLVRRRQRS
ncbi:MAG TPA: hypothetical protein VII83_05920 [Gaiellaceae bacterium]